MFIAAVPMGRDIYFEPVWTKNIHTDVKPATETIDSGSFHTPGVEAFILKDTFGFFTPEGNILSSKMIPERVSVSPTAWTLYGHNERNTEVFSPEGTPKLIVTESGFVHLDETRTYLFHPQGDAVSQIGEDGKPIWKREHTAPITAFNSSGTETIIGYADGLLTCLKNDGTELFSFYPGGSNNQVILGASISEDGKMAACVSGIDKQRFVLIKITGNQYKVIYHRYLEGNLRRQACVDFEKNNNFAFFETATGLGIIDCHRLKSSIIPVQGQIMSIGDTPGDSLFLVLSKNGLKYTLSAIERPNHLISTSEFFAENAFLIQRKEALYLGTDDRISRINIRGTR